MSLNTIKKECPVIKKKNDVHKAPQKIVKKIEKKVSTKTPIKPKKPKIYKKKIKKIVKIKKIKPKVEKENIAQKESKKEVIEKVVEVSKKNLPQKRKVVSTKKCETVSKEKNYINNNLNKISSLIKENLYYPRRARKRGVEGTVIVKFFLHKDATVSNIEVLSSNSEILSRAATKTILELSGKFPKPVEELTLKVPINYALH
ncbi:TonB family protein [Sulfurimonas sp.]